MWPRTSAGPEEDGDLRHVEWVRRVQAAVGDAAMGLYINEVRRQRMGGSRTPGGKTGAWQGLGQRCKRHGLKVALSMCAQVMLDQPGQVFRCYTESTLSQLKILKARCDPLSLLRPLGVQQEQ